VSQWKGGVVVGQINRAKAFLYNVRRYDTHRFGGDSNLPGSVNLKNFNELVMVSPDKRHDGVIFGVSKQDIYASVNNGATWQKVLSIPFRLPRIGKKPESKKKRPWQKFDFAYHKKRKLLMLASTRKPTSNPNPSHIELNTLSLAPKMSKHHIQGGEGADPQKNDEALPFKECSLIGKLTRAERRTSRKNYAPTKSSCRQHRFTD